MQVCLASWLAASIPGRDGAGAAADGFAGAAVHKTGVAGRVGRVLRGGGRDHAREPVADIGEIQLAAE